MLRSLLYTTLCFLAIGCGKDQGVQARLHQKTTITPELIQQNSVALVTGLKEFGAYKDTISSQAIRKDTLGFRITTTPNNNSTVNIRIEHFENFEQNKCRNTVQNIENVAINKLTDWSKISTLRLKCYDGSCNNMILVMEKTNSSFVDGNGTFVEAFVPVMLETKDPINGARNYFTQMAKYPFLGLEINTICNKAEATTMVSYQTHQVIAPVDNIQQNFNYYPDPDNNTWIY